MPITDMALKVYFYVYNELKRSFSSLTLSSLTSGRTAVINNVSEKVLFSVLLNMCSAISFFFVVMDLCRFQLTNIGNKCLLIHFMKIIITSYFKFYVFKRLYTGPYRSL